MSSTILSNSPFNKPKVAAIVPAFNEAGRIGDVLRAIAAAEFVDEIIVVTDGCTDSTAEEARGVAARLQELFHHSRSLRVFELEQNLGKGGAMTYAAHRTDAEVLLFLDADLIGLRPQQVDAIIEPMLLADIGERADMTLGLFGAPRGGIFGWWLACCHRTYAALTGQRAIRRDVFLAIPNLTRSRFGVEMYITRHVHAWQLKVTGVTLDGITHPIKEEKVGVFKGVRHRLNMYAEIWFYVLKENLRNSVSESHRHQTLKMRERFGGNNE